MSKKKNPLKILHLEDDISIRRGLRMYYGDAGFEADVVGSMDEALEKMRGGEFDIYVVDLKVKKKRVRGKLMGPMDLLLKAEKIYPPAFRCVFSGVEPGTELPGLEVFPKRTAGPKYSHYIQMLREKAENHFASEDSTQLRVLHLEDSELVNLLLRRRYPEACINVSIVETVSEAYKLMKKEKFDVVVVDVVNDNSTYVRGVGNVTPLDILRLSEVESPETRRIIFSAIKPEEELKGVAFVEKDSEGIKKLIELISKLKGKTPAGDKLQAPMDLTQFMKPILHTDATGKREMITLIEANADNQQVLTMLRQGWRPMSVEKAEQRLRDHGREAEFEKMDPGTAFRKIDDHLVDSANRMKRKHKR